MAHSHKQHRTEDSDSEISRPLTFNEKFKTDKNSNEEVLGAWIRLLFTQLF